MKTKLSRAEIRRAKHMKFRIIAQIEGPHSGIWVFKTGKPYFKVMTVEALQVVQRICVLGRINFEDQWPISREELVTLARANVDELPLSRSDGDDAVVDHAGNLAPDETGPTKPAVKPEDAPTDDLIYVGDIHTKVGDEVVSIRVSQGTPPPEVLKVWQARQDAKGTPTA